VTYGGFAVTLGFIAATSRRFSLEELAVSCIGKVQVTNLVLVLMIASIAAVQFDIADTLRVRTEEGREGWQLD
jgi:hypothetical protein